MRLFQWRRNLLLILIGSSVLVSGCMKIGPNYVRPKTTISSNWLEEKDERVRTEPIQHYAWWKVFNDPILNRIIDRAYHENLSLRIAGVRVLEARAKLGIAVGGLYPQTQQASGSLTFDRTSGRSFFSTGGQGGTQLSYWQDQIGLNAAWEIDFWGKFRRAVESANAALLAAVADYDSALVSLTADAASYYVQIRTLEKRLEIARQNVNNQTEGLKLAEARFKGGLTSERDVEQARTILFNTQATIPILQAQLRQAKNALSLLLGLPPDNLANILEGVRPIPAPPPYVAIGIPADLLRRRPDVRSAELQAMAQSAQIGIAKADLLPAFSLTGSFGFLSTTLGQFGLSDIVDWRARTASIGPSVQWNILNYGRITNNVRMQDARFQELLISYQNIVLKAQQEVEDSLAGFLRAQETAVYLAQSTQAAKTSLELAFVQYQKGSTDFTTVIAAQQAFLNAQDSFAVALGNISGNLVGLYRALGGGWEISKGEDILPANVKEMMAERTNWGKLLSTSAYVPPPKAEQDVRLPDW